MARLREAPDDLFALVGQASEGLRLPQEFIEKDFWITELLRSVTQPIDDAYVVFKGGTSLSKAFGFIERFSEDVDVLLVVTRPFDRTFGKGSVDKILKSICSRAGEDLGLGENDLGLEGSGTGEHRNVRYRYPTRFPATVVRAGVLLEMGVRGGPDPRSSRTIRSFISQFATESLKVPQAEYEEFAAVEVEVLSPERTLFEKLAMLHHLASHYPETADKLSRDARHLYDVFKLIANPELRRVLQSRAGLAAELASDIDAISEKWGWAHTKRPVEGYAVSPLFDSSHPCQEALAAGWTAIRPLVHGEVPTLEQCRTSAQEAAHLL
ncbi:MAG: nucleotidyl transferase AbiEii/AbiGii toxin family protein [Actinomycetota bacterium]